MKIKPLFIRFESMDAFFSSGKSTIRNAIKSNKKSIDKKNIQVWASVEAYQQFMSDQKYSILAAIYKHKPNSVYQLAKLLKRAQQNVARDCSILEAHGFIEFKKSAGVRRAKAPTLSFDYNAIIICMPTITYKVEFDVAA